MIAAELLAQAGIHVDVYDAMPSVRREFLMAGKGGMNISHSEPLVDFLTRYGSRRENIEPHYKPSYLLRCVNEYVDLEKYMVHFYGLTIDY